MALGKRSNSMKISGQEIGEEESRRLGCVRFTRSFGRKRVVIDNGDLESLMLDSSIRTPLKRTRSLEFDKSKLECLPQDILIKVICGVNHEDLEQLALVSTVIKEVTMIAKKLHFEYTTPRKVQAFKTQIDFEDETEFDEIEAPNAPKQSRCYKSRLNKKNIADISIALFT